MLTVGQFLSFCVAAFFTLAIFSFLYRDNPVYKFAEHVFVGVATGYGVVMAYRDTIVPRLWQHVAGGEATWYVRLAGGLLALALLMHVWPRMSWLARWPIALMVGATAGVRVVGHMQAEVVAQVEGMIEPVWRPELPWWSLRGVSVLGNVVVLAGVIAVLLHFFFSARRGPALRAASRAGVMILMVTFGAHFGLTVLGRISLLIGRARDLERYGWATALAAAVVIGLIALWAWWDRAAARGGDHR